LSAFALLATANPSVHLITLPDSHVRLELPADVTIDRDRINWETDHFTLRRRDSVLVDIILGGGANDLTGFRPFCLNGKRAWDSGPPRRRSHRQVVIGNSGVNSMVVSYKSLSLADAAIADRVISSIWYNEGGDTCSS
jgi:hypothetical protein